MKIKHISVGLLIAVAFLLGGLIAGYIISSNLYNYLASGAPATRDANGQTSRLGQTCVPTHSVAEVGNLNSLDILAANRSRAFSIIQQPLNATNTVTLDIASSSSVVSGVGYILGTTTDTESHIFPLEFELGVQVNRPATTTVTAITNSGSTTVNVIDCIYD